MNDQAGPTSDGWQKALDDLESILREASGAIAALRVSLQNGARAVDGVALSQDPTVAPVAVQPNAESISTEAPPVAPPPQPAASVAQQAEPAPPAPAKLASAASTFDRLWDRIENERIEKQGDEEERKGLESLPQQYLMTVEDREGKVDLVLLHRALADLAEVEETSLVSYANGVPVLSLRVEGELNMEQLGRVVGSAMDRECEVIPQDTGRLYLRMKAVGS